MIAPPAGRSAAWPVRPSFLRCIVGRAGLDLPIRRDASTCNRSGPPRPVRSRLSRLRAPCERSIHDHHQS